MFQTKFPGKQAPGPPSNFAPSALTGLRQLEPDHFEKSDDGPAKEVHNSERTSLFSSARESDASSSKNVYSV
ncbi:hypothetical protein DPMN_181387 [Dreissena polymorpha]|uniref:Uncharacterized protein n=1 Tax=Dreissena polymorpha TaxID=45954 RepID=A0A9D4I595_DREPO|nr:hypothetical protein DPMN_181387 [Dreissena polymorpha]